MNRLIIAIVLLAAIVAIACGQSRKEAIATAVSVPENSPTSAVTARPTTVAATPTPAGAILTDLSLVYLDRSQGQGVEVYTSASDGGTPRLAGKIEGPVKALDLRGRMLAYSGNNQLIFFDLVAGAGRPMTAPGTMGQGRFLNDTTFIYTVNGGCGPQRAAVMSVDIPSMQQKELVGTTGNLSIAGLDAATGTIAIVPRGCDPGVQNVILLSTADGREIAKLDTPGCGSVDANVVRKQVIVSRTLCTLDSPTSPQSTLYDYSGASLTRKDIIGPSGGINFSPVLLRPNSNEAVFGTKAPGATTGPGAARATGIWQIDLATLATSVLVAGEGAEQSPIAFTPDGRYLLVQSVQAQGVCSYVIADASNKQVKPVNKDITYCGVNGEIVGWTSLK